MIPNRKKILGIKYLFLLIKYNYVRAGDTYNLNHLLKKGSERSERYLSKNIVEYTQTFEKPKPKTKNMKRRRASTKNRPKNTLHGKGSSQVLF